MKGYHDLLAGCKKGDARSQRVLFDMFKARLMGLCRRYTRDRDEAKDVLQDSFIKIFNNIQAVESADKLESWMKSIAVNTAINHYHRNRKHDDAMPIKDSDEHIPALDQPEHTTDEFLLKLINDLPDGCRMIFNMFCVEGYSHSEISRLLLISEGTSRSQLNYAKQLLKEKLKCQNLAHYYEKFA